MIRDYGFLLIIIIMSIIIILLQLWLESRKKLKLQETKTMTMLKCVKCGETVETDFQPGDFISLIKGKCPKCGSPMRIEAIYSIEIKPTQKRKA